jgi:hypothetical protein
MEAETLYTQKGKKSKNCAWETERIIQDKNTLFMTAENARKILLKEKL